MELVLFGEPELIIVEDPSVILVASRQVVECEDYALDYQQGNGET